MTVTPSSPPPSDYDFERLTQARPSRREGLIAAWWNVFPPAVIFVGLIILLTRPLGRSTIPVALASAAVIFLGGTVRRHAALRELARYIAGFIAFAALRHLADDFGPPAYVQYPIVLDRLLAFGAIPSHVLQASLPGLVYPAVMVYMSYFAIPELAMGLLWRFWPDRLRAYVSASLALFLIAAVIHFIAPTAPPWVAAQMGFLPGVRPVVLDYYRATLPTAFQFGTGVSSNLVAAMPSVHLGVTTLIACAMWRTPLRWPALCYFVAMALTVVYTGDHYVVDVIAGITLALGCWRWATKPSPA